MTQDIKLVRDDDGVLDLTVVDSVFDTVDGLETAIIISLLTDARAASSVVFSPSRRRGWVGNILTADSGRQLGSRLWTFHQSRLTDAILNDIAVASEQAFAWMIEDGVARSVSATALRTDIRAVTINIDIVTIEGREERYAVLWRQTGDI